MSSRVDTYKYSFFPRVVPIRNKLPDYAISAENFDLFNKIHKWYEIVTKQNIEQVFTFKHGLNIG